MRPNVRIHLCAQQPASEVEGCLAMAAAGEGATTAEEPACETERSGALLYLDGDGQTPEQQLPDGLPAGHQGGDPEALQGHGAAEENGQGESLPSHGEFPHTGKKGLF